MAQTVSLDEKDHAVDILHNLKDMQLEEDLCDFTIHVRDDTIRAHKCILSASSQYFKAMFKYDTKESQEDKVEMKEVDVDCVRSCIKFIYTGKFDIPCGKTTELLHVAILLQLDKIKQSVCNILKKSLSCDNFYSTREMAMTYDLQSVLSSCVTFYCLNFATMSSKPEFTSEPKSHLMEVFDSKNLISSEREKLQAALRWSRGDPDKKNDLLELVNLVNLKAVSSDFLKNLLENDLIICGDFHLYKLITAQLMETLSDLSKKAKDNERLLLFDNNAYCLQEFEPVSREFAKVQSSDFFFSLNFTALCLGDFVYALCHDKRVYQFNVKEGCPCWIRMADMASNHGSYPPSVSLAGSLYVIGAGEDMDPCKSTERFEPTANKWLNLKSRSKAIAGAALVALGDSIYCIGGWRTACSNQTTAFCRFTPSTSEWFNLPQLRYARSYSSAVATNEKIFVVGGFRGMSVTAMMECYNVALQQWTTVSGLPLQVPDVLAQMANSSIYVTGRHQSCDKILKYDITKDVWWTIEMKSEYSICDFVVALM